MQSKSFEAFGRPDAVALILGTLPGQQSLIQARYYAHPRNAFWPIMGKLIGAGLDMPYEQRVEKLLQSRIALWDVCAAGFRPGSLDSNISNPVPNDFAGFFKSHRQIQLIAFNGQPAHKLYKKLVLLHLPEALQKIPYEVLPSTSPAHAGRTFEQKYTLWQTALHKANIGQ